MRNQKVFVWIFFDKMLQASGTKSPQIFGEINGELNLDLNVVTLLVWMNLSRTSKTAQNPTKIKNPPSSSRLPQVSDSFHLKASFKFFTVYFKAGENVLVYLVECSVFCFSALFSNGGSKVEFNIYPKLWNCFLIKINSRRVLQTLCFFLQRWVFQYATAWGRPASVSNHFITCKDYTKVEHVKTWRLSSSLAMVTTV